MMRRIKCFPALNPKTMKKRKREKNLKNLFVNRFVVFAVVRPVSRHEI